ncbi:hypothetical protein HJFPF1_13470 [Paramyrothecium foliicola]|nr:hypothetical protein HJFPF1_13470 [Paramyrothecium foliicola]
MTQEFDYYLEEWHFTTEANEFRCSSGWTCEPPRACAFDTESLRSFCCDSAESPGASCWTFGATASNQSDVFECTRQGESWWCMEGRYWLL